MKDTERMDSERPWLPRLSPQLHPALARPRLKTRKCCHESATSDITKREERIDSGSQVVFTRRKQLLVAAGEAGADHLGGGHQRLSDQCVPSRFT